MTGDIRTNISVPLAFLDSFSAMWCDTPNDCGKAANGLMLSGAALGELGRHKTNRDLDVTLEVQNRFIFTSTSELELGECTVTFTVADERGFRGSISCPKISNGEGLGVLTVSVEGTFAATG